MSPGDSTHDRRCERLVATIETKFTLHVTVMFSTTQTETGPNRLTPQVLAELRPLDWNRFIGAQANS